MKELKGFQRIALQPNETKRVPFTIARHDLEFWSNNGWVYEPGTFNVWIGPSSDAGLKATLVMPARAGSSRTSRLGAGVT